MISTVIIVFVFTFFYSFLIFKPDDISKGLQNNEGTIIGIRPGTETEKFLTKLMNKLNLIGAISMSVIVLIPILTFSLIGYVGLQPTSIIILAGVALEIIQSIKVEYLSRTCVSKKSSALIRLVGSKAGVTKGKKSKKEVAICEK
jgi:preprotein translocase subunit SecY